MFMFFFLMLRRHPEPTRADTFVPYTPLFGADQSARPGGVNLPDEIARREDRLAAIAEAKAAIEARARERDAHEQAVYQAKLAQREAKRKATGKKPGGKPPTPPTAGPRADDQINLTDADRSDERRLGKEGVRTART